MKWKIVYNEEECIGCGACTVQCPENWELVNTDQGMKAKPKQIELDQLGKNDEAKDVCPVDAIDVVEVKEE